MLLPDDNDNYTDDDENNNDNADDNDIMMMTVMIMWWTKIINFMRLHLLVREEEEVERSGTEEETPVLPSQASFSWRQASYSSFVQIFTRNPAYGKH